MNPKRPSPTIKTVLYQADDNAVELFTLTRGTNCETYLRRGGNIELVTETPDLNWKPETATRKIDLKIGTTGDWKQTGGLNVIKPPKTR